LQAGRSIDGKPPRRTRSRTVSRLGLVPARSNSEERRLVAAIAAAMGSSTPAAAMTLLGTTLDDLGLMQIGNLFVTGMIDPADFTTAVKSYGLEALLLTATRPIFGHPIIELAFASGLPVAFFDWSRGRLKSRHGDLVLDPKNSFDETMVLVRRWMAKS
jgi:O-antigen biosynthesis protein